MGCNKEKERRYCKKVTRLHEKVGGNLILISHAKQTAMTDDKAQLSPSLPSGLEALCAKADVVVTQLLISLLKIMKYHFRDMTKEWLVAD